MRQAGGTPDLTKSRRLARELGRVGGGNDGSPAAADGCPLVELALSLQDGRAMARRSALLALLLLAPSLAAAQATPGSGAITVVESADPTEVNPPYINIAECNGTTTDTLTYYWNVSTSFTSGGTYELWIADKPSSSTACPA